MTKLEKEAVQFCKKVKAQGMEREMAWSQWVKFKGLVPGMDAKEFYEIFDTTFPDTDHIKLPDYLQIDYKK